MAQPDRTTYSYDPTGNRLSKVLGGTTTSYAYDKADRILSAGATNYSVNAAGNQTARGSDTFSYDQANRLTSVTVNGVTSTYTYDGDGKRISRTVAGVSTTYVYDVNGGLPVLLDDGSRKYVWGAGGLADSVDKTSGAVQVYHTDGLGSVRALTDNSGSVVQAYGTDEFGIPTATSTMGTSPQSMQYAGEQRDSESTFMYLRARMYDPTVGRFIQADPLRHSGFGVGGWNRYAYAANEPIRSTDPSGLDATLSNRARSELDSTAFPGKSRILRSTEPIYSDRALTYFAQFEGPDGEAVTDLLGRAGEVISDVSSHAVDNMNQLGISAEDVADALNSPLNAFYDFERESYRFIGNRATVIVNGSGRVITVYFTARKILRRLGF